MDIPDELKAVQADLQNGRTVTPVTIRRFLSWFGAQRRTEGNVFHINQRLEKLKIKTVPDYLSTWVDTPITFELIKEQEETQQEGSTKEVNNAESAANSSGNDSTAYDDPSFRVGKIEAASRTPVSVKPNATLQEAITLMLAQDFSQLPVMPNERDLKGVISWKSIGVRSMSGKNGPDVQSYMDDPHEIPASASLFAAIKIIQEHDYVLIRTPDKRISGLVTAFDVSEQFEKLSTPFLLVSEIENHLRVLISAKLSINDIKKTCDPTHLPKDFSTVHELTFGNYVKILEHSGNWSKLGLTLDRASFCKELDAINAIRNEVMHFDPDPMGEQDFTRLRNVSRMFDTLRSIGAF